MPPLLKTRALARAAASLHRRRPADEVDPIFTNLGISPGLRVRIPIDADWLYAFGRPDLNESEQGALEAARFLAAGCGSFVDIGAHRGLFVFHVANSDSRPARILFFEPEPTLFRELTENLRANTIGGVTGFGAAIGSSSGQATFYIDDSDKSSSSLTRDFADIHEIHPCTVDLMSFRDLAAREGLRGALVKVDVEGAEAAFIEGSEGSAGAIAYLIIEMLGPAIKAGLVARAESHFSMNAYYIDHFSLHRSPGGAHTYAPGQFNWLFAKENPAQLRKRLVGSRLTVLG